MRKWLNKYFVMNRAEYNGLVTLWVLIILVTLAPATFSWLFPERNQPLEPHILAQFKESREYIKNGKNYYPRKAPTKQSELFFFDPNTISVSDWQRLGLSEKQASAVINYRNKGGKFRTVDDVKKMYTINAAMYARLAPFVQIKVDAVNTAKSYVPVKLIPMPVIEINTADTLVLLDVNGIGPAFARRIFNYRERLGGFVNKAQLLEVYGLDSAKLSEIQAQIRIDDTQIKRIPINNVSFEALRKHPYLRYKEANAIIQYKKQHGNYSNIADLTKVATLSAETIAKLEPYLSFEL